jgi:cellulose synthase/poly-beta-1,6-N-acetylglucosamine synthase-like glycosyltransferase
VVIPVRNEAAYIESNLEALRGQDYPLDRIEVLVADGRSEDATREIVTAVAERWVKEGGSCSVRIVDNPERVMPTGVNAAIREASGDLVLLLGGHARLPPSYIRECVECLIAEGVDGTSGAVESVSRGIVGEAIAALMSSPFGIGNSDFRIAKSGGRPVPAETIPFPLFRRTVYERVGLYNPHMVRHQDYEFNYRVRQAGGRMLLLPGLKATYHVRSSLRVLWRQYWQYGVYKGRFVRRFPKSLKLRHLVPSIFTLAVVVAAALALFHPLGRLALLALLLPYAFFVMAAMVSFAAEKKWKTALLAPAVMFCLHFGYGLGIWVGLLQGSVPPAPALEPRSA